VNAIENSMVLPDVTPAQYQDDGDDVVVVALCPNCSTEIAEDDADAVSNGVGTFCNQVCVSQHLFSNVQTASGKAALMRFVAALSLLVEEDVLSRVPELGFRQYDLDTLPVPNNPNFRFASIEVIREQAMAMLRLFDIEGDVSWAARATELSIEFGENLGKEVK
jgi:hypothetical protein